MENTMTQQELVQKIKALINDPTFTKKLEEAKSSDDFISIFATEGVTVTQQDIRQLEALSESLDEDGTLSEEALESVSGGLIGTTTLIALLYLAGGGAAIGGLFRYGIWTLFRK